ncbi:MAG: phenylalanine--tRNA ligase subunit beta [Proteobacteria bacterium]|nr:phenylalanine--tRNA ligase subunit beta [Pseudomonadota bacterium]
MKVSLSWLKEWVEVTLAPQALASRLTLAGFEVESCEPAAADFSGVVVASLLEAAPHPQADKLRVCRVDVGGGQILQIVCGAANARAGLKVALAQVGASLPGGMAIKAAALRGVESQGMLCSARELGMAQTSDGILELPADAPLGVDLRTYLDLNDTIIDVSIYPNRGDAMSVQGLSREVSALLRQPSRRPAWQPVSTTSTATHGLKVLAPKAAPRVLTRAHTGESLQLLDGRQIALATDELVIADSSKAIGLAGVMGGMGSSMTTDTSTVLLEVAYFAPSAIAGRARRHGLQTDASQRFERGVDPQGQMLAMERATQLLLELCGGSAGPIAAAVEEGVDAPRASLVLRRNQLTRLLGVSFADDEVAQALQALQMRVEALPEGWRISPPSWRFDLAIEPDLIEEVARVIGLDRITEVPARFPQRFGKRPESLVDERVVLDTLVVRGYQEAINYAFCDPVIQQRLLPEMQSVKLANPIAANMGVMRLSLWPGLLQAALDNQRRQQDRVRLFELGSVFLREGTVVSEPRRVAGIALGLRVPEQWADKAEDVGFHDVKADLEALISLSNASQDFVFDSKSLPCLHPGRSAAVYRDGVCIGHLGELHPELVKQMGFVGAPVLFELDLIAATRQTVARAAQVSRFPQVRRDLSVTLPRETPLSALQTRVRVAAGTLLRELRCFDVYQGQGIESGRKSIAFGLILQDNDKTLTDEDADRLVTAVADDLRLNLDARLRE